MNIMCVYNPLPDLPYEGIERVIEAPDELLKVNLTNFEEKTRVFPYKENEIEIDANKFILKDNSYTSNFFGLGRSLVEVEHVSRVHFLGETYSRNCDTFLEALHEYGQITETSSEFKFEKLHMTDTVEGGRSLIYVNVTGFISMEYSSFTGNYLVES